MYSFAFVFEINTWINHSHVGPREDSFRSANEERKRPRVSEQVCMNKKKSPSKTILMLTRLDKWISYTLEQKKIKRRPTCSYPRLSQVKKSVTVYYSISTCILETCK